MRKVLIVEDDRRFRLLLRRKLEKRFSLEVLEAEDGLKGLEVFYQYNPKMIFLDLDMPLMRGNEFLKKIREVDPEVPVVVITNHSDGESVKEILELGVIDYILKPEVVLQDSERLEDTIRKYKHIFMINTN